VNVLLRQADGFEGFLAVHERLCPKDLSGSQPKSGGDGCLSSRTTLLAAPGDVRHHNYRSSGVDEVARYEFEGLIGVIEHLEVREEPGMATKVGLDRHEPRYCFDAGIGQVKEPVEVSAVVERDPSLDDLHVLLRHRLLRESGRLEGLAAILEIVLPDHQAAAQSEELKEGLAHEHTASRSLRGQLGRHENAVSEVEEFLGLEASVGGFEQMTPKLPVAVVAVEDRAYVGEHMSHAKLDAGIKADDEHVEVASIQRRKSLSYAANKYRSTEPRVLRQSRPRGTQLTGKPREANKDSFLQRTVPPRLRYERDSDGSRGLHVLLRHRPRSIPQAQGSA
jgi:hypothetical protein